MSIVVIGRSICTICGRTLEQGEEIVGFPAFKVNELDPLAFFSDASFHIRCFEEHRSSAKVRQRMAEREKKVGPQNRICDICAKPVDSYKEFFSLGFLTDEDDPAFALNYFRAHKGCMSTWPKLQEMHGTLKALRASDNWSGNGLDHAISEIEVLTLS